LEAAAAALLQNAVGGGGGIVLREDGTPVDPPPPLTLKALAPVAGRDPEGEFYLLAAERAEIEAGCEVRVRDLCETAAAPERDRTGRALALYRFAAVLRPTW
jgi:hypothetical protein